MQPTADGSRWERFVDSVDGGDSLVVEDPVDERALVRTGTVPAATGLATDRVRYVLTHGELEAGASGAAAPLLGVPGVEGSVGVVMLAEAVPERVGPRVVEAATEVSDALR
jgi:hypothetical protein